MRNAIAIGIATFLGLVLGILVARAHFSPRIAEIAMQRDNLAQESERLAAELQFAAERLQFVEADSAALRQQLEALQARAGWSSGSMQGTGGPGADGDVGSDTGGKTSAFSQVSDSGAAGQASGSSPGPSVPPRGYTGLAVVEQERVRLQDFLDAQIQTSPDPVEQARLIRLQENMVSIRDLYTQLREAATLEERQAILRQVASTRAEMRDIIMDQRASLIRQTLEQGGVSDPTQQEHLIAAIEQLQESPYYTDHMLVWGMAPQPRPPQ